MTTAFKERVYLIIIFFCLLMCALLIFCVFTGRPIPVYRAPLHSPVLRALSSALEASTPSKKITEARLESGLLALLPKDFPLDALDATIKADGILALDASLGRTELLEYMEALGVKLSFKQRLATKFLPRQLALRIAFSFKSQNGENIPVLEGLRLGNKNISLTPIPPQAFDSFSVAISGYMRDMGFIGDIVFTDGAMIIG